MYCGYVLYHTCIPELNLFFLFTLCLCLAPSSPPQQVSGVAQSSTLLLFSWLPPPLLDVNGIINYYIVRVRETNTGRLWTFYTIEEHIQIASLLPYSYYDCTVSAYTVGAGPFSHSVSVRTLQAGW